MKTMNILIIDDKANKPDYPRKSIIDTLTSDNAHPINYKFIEPKLELIRDENFNEYNLILVDYVFESLPDSSFRTGSPIYSYIRDDNKDVPIYLISVLSGDIGTIGEFDSFISDEQLTRPGFLYLEALSHQQLKVKVNISVSEFIRQLKAPKEDEESIQSTLPKALHKINQQQDDRKKITINESLNISAYRWLAHKFLAKNGFLLSDKAAACFLGLKLEKFNSIQRELNDARYTGLFNQTCAPRWWKSKLEDLIIAQDTDENLLSNYSFSEAAYLLLSGNKNDVAVCVKCDGEFPDSLGYILGNPSTELHMVHTFDSERDESMEDEPFFETPRVIKGED